MFKKILIANRGEIAVRITKTLQQMGIAVAAIYSPSDEHALHRLTADESHRIDGTGIHETYLNGKKIIEIAKACGADAIHPGTGLLSENASFASLCEQSGMGWIGPSSAAIRATGDKLAAKALAKESGVPVIPGVPLEEISSTASLSQSIQEIGYPVLLKPAAGGGGIGVHPVAHEDELKPALDRARRMAHASFGDSRLLIEKCIARPRHIEFQIIGDHYGHVSHLFERECSIQRRFQKIVEESPGSSLSPALRSRMGAYATKMALAAGYTNAGTVEFLLDENNNPYFLEMNTRLQVEHPVTEMVLRTDLVRLQIEAAAGKELPLLQIELRPHGHAIECRIYSENPEQNFVPSTGIIRKYLPPEGPNIRVDSGITEGTQITADYDPLLAKLIVWGESRQEALARMTWALEHFVVLGVATNLEFLERLIAHPEFQNGNLHTQFLDEHETELFHPGAVSDEALFLAASLSQITEKKAPAGNGTPVSSAHKADPWTQIGGWRSF